MKFDTCPLFGHADYPIDYPWITIAPGKSVNIVIRGTVDLKATVAFAAIDTIAGNYNSDSLLSSLKKLPMMLPVVDEIPSEGVVNTSVLTTVSPDRSTVVGFIVKGDPRHRYPILIRAIGPGLKQFGVKDILVDPYLMVFDKAGKLIADDKHLGEGWDFEEIFAYVGAFALDKGSSDSAVFIYLEPGAYTAQVKGFFTGQGQVLIEVYPMPPSYGKG